VNSVWSWVSVSSRNVCGMSERRFRRTAGGVCLLGLHVVWCLKYRRQILGGRVAARCGELLEQFAGERGWAIVAREVMADHVQLVVWVGPTDARAQVVRAVKGRTARVLRQEFSYLQRLVKVLWSRSYFVASVGYVWESTVRRYVEQQCDAVA
jgi:putative transposase